MIANQNALFLVCYIVVCFSTVINKSENRKKREIKRKRKTMTKRTEKKMEKSGKE